MPRARTSPVSVLCLGLVAVGTVLVVTQGKATDGEWRSYGGDKSFTRYSPLAQVTRDNVSQLRIAWRRPAVDPRITAAFPDLSPSAYLRSTPIILNGVLYAPNAVGLIEAFQPATGKTVWVQEPIEGGLAGVAGQSTRGVDTWASGSDQRLLSVRGDYLYALNVQTGRLYPNFGDLGRVNLKRTDPFAAAHFSWTSGPLVVGEVVIVAGAGGGAGDLGVTKEAAPEDVRAFDVRTGRLRWTFHVRPREGEFGLDTWGNDSWKFSGSMGAWVPLTADEQLGYVYLPLSAPPNSLYGGHRPGQNLFSDSLVCLNAKTGERVWHFQMVHHDLWDYDNVNAPILGEITVNGKRIKAVMQPSKTGFLYVFDRVTGTPVWPIEERPVPASTVPGEQAWPTQPFPTKPPAFDRQGLTENDLIDFTPELKAEALAIARQYRLGPLFTPPSLVAADNKGTIVVPGTAGGGNWHTGAFDPETGIFYAVSHTIPWVNGVEKPTSPKATERYATASPEEPGEGQCCHVWEVTGPHGLPLTKPPYGRITALDLNRGEQAWMVPNGDGPRNHPLLKDLHLPPLGIPGRPTPLLTKTLLFLGEGSDAITAVPIGGWGNTFRAYDKGTGQVLWAMDLPAGTTGGPMTYLYNGKQFIVVPIGGKQHPAEWVALSLP
jgi:glucose dehydrogenase